MPGYESQHVIQRFLSLRSLFLPDPMILLQDLRSCEDPVAGLMPDTVSVLYFLEEKETKDKQLKSLRGIVRFGAQATQSMSRGEAEEDGN